MKKKNLLFPCFIALVIAGTFLSCKKTENPFPIYKGCDVAEFLGPILVDSTYAPPLVINYPIYFKKTYDPITNAVKEIDCSFFNASSPSHVVLYHLLVSQSNGMLLFFDQNDPGDTLVKVKFNTDGRVQSWVSTLPNSPDNPYTPLANSYHYKNGRLSSLDASGIIASHSINFSFSDTFHYDNYGNLLSHLDNSYQYDYTKKAKQQFYEDDYMGYNNVFYLLQYMGLFPELTSPSNVRIYANSVEAHHAITNQTFDGEGKLLSYGITYPPNPVTITWNCGNTGNDNKK